MAENLWSVVVSGFLTEDIAQAFAAQLRGSNMPNSMNVDVVEYEHYPDEEDDG